MTRHLLTILATLAGFLLTPHLSRAEPPRLLKEKEFTSATFAEAVNHFVDLGEKGAIEELKAAAMEHSEDFKNHGNGDWSVNERIGCMCRVLFHPKESDALRPPAFGGLHLPYQTMPSKDWPLYPVAVSGPTYFVLSEGYSLEGIAEPPPRYIDYCQKNGTFRTERVAVPTGDQTSKDARTLRESKQWTQIKWSDSGENWRYTFDEAWAWKFIQDQADRIPR